MSRSPSSSTRRLDEEVRRLLAEADDTRAGSRRENGRDRPLGKKATQTRATLLGAAYECFVAEGYRSTSVQDIHEAAGVSLGTFYQYFRDKADVIATLVAELVAGAGEELFPQLDVESEAHGPGHIVERFVRNYAATADFQQVWEEVTHIEEVAGRFRWGVSRVIDAAVQSAIERGQRTGSVATDLDPAGTARALGAMVDRYCYRTFVVDARRDPDTVDDTVAVLTTLWEHALGLR